MATPLRCLRSLGWREAGQLGRFTDTTLRREILVAGHQRRWQTSGGLGDSNSATEGEFVPDLPLHAQCAQPMSSHVDLKDACLHESGIELLDGILSRFMQL